jgi:coproporphyrinogen III oxidase-like Fe-S oxidoreductase
MMLGLRLTEAGIDINQFAHRFGKTPADIWPEHVSKFTRLGLLENLNDLNRIVLTDRGVFMANDVMAEFI